MSEPPTRRTKIKIVNKIEGKWEQLRDMSNFGKYLYPAHPVVKTCLQPWLKYGILPKYLNKSKRVPNVLDSNMLKNLWYIHFWHSRLWHYKKTESGCMLQYLRAWYICPISVTVKVKIWHALSPKRNGIRSNYMTEAHVDSIRVALLQKRLYQTCLKRFR